MHYHVCGTFYWKKMTIKLKILHLECSSSLRLSKEGEKQTIILHVGDPSFKCSINALFSYLCMQLWYFFSMKILVSHLVFLNNLFSVKWAIITCKLK